MWFWIIYATIVISTLVASLIIGARFKGTLHPDPLPADAPKISVIVPARNEERNIERCLQGLMHQTYGPFEVIVVDDASQDATPHILQRYASQDARIRVKQTPARPADWNGKQWACHVGAQAADGDWFCFMDADTFAEPDLLIRTFAFAHKNQIDFLTLQPWYEIVGLWERITMPAGLMPLLLVFPPGRVNNPDNNVVIANGQFILIRRAAYHAVEGHAGVRGRMMDDFSLAENIHGAGYRIYMADGMNVLRVRMYHNLKEMWAGALKASVQLTGGWFTSTVALLTNLAINVAPLILFIWAVLTDHWAATVTMSVVVAAQLLYAALVRVLAFRAPPWSAISHALGSLLVSLMLADGMLRITFNREIKWKDRPVLGAPAPPVSRLRSRRDQRS